MSTNGFVRALAPAVDGLVNFGYTLRVYATTSGLLGQIALRNGLDVPPPDPPYIAGEVAPVPARIYRNQWIAECPTPGCGDASFGWLAEPWYMCANCFNAEVGGRWRTVEFPSEEERAAIVAVLARRVLPRYRNWAPGETVADLEAQNLEQGDDVPPAGREAG